MNVVEFGSRLVVLQRVVKRILHLPSDEVGCRMYVPLTDIRLSICALAPQGIVVPSLHFVEAKINPAVRAAVHSMRRTTCKRV